MIHVTMEKHIYICIYIFLGFGARGAGEKRDQAARPGLAAGSCGKFYFILFFFFAAF